MPTDCQQVNEFSVDLPFFNVTTLLKTLKVLLSYFLNRCNIGTKVLVGMKMYTSLKRYFNNISVQIKHARSPIDFLLLEYLEDSWVQSIIIH